MKLKNCKAKIISILLLILMVFNFISPLKSNSYFIGVLTKPLLYPMIGAMDAINSLSTILFVGADEWDKIKEDLDNNTNNVNSKDPAAMVEAFKKTGYNVMMSPDKIFSGQVSMLNANIFTADTSKNPTLQTLQSGVGSSIASVLKKSVANIYVVLRNICAVVLLCLLIYTGIRILLSSVNPLKQAQWKQIMFDWIKALCLLIFMHYIMIGIFYISDLLVEALGKSWGNISIVAIIRLALDDQSIFDGTGCYLYYAMYGYVSLLTIYFFISYFKRLVWIIILIVISPVVATTYAIGNNTKSIFSRWFKEYIYAVLIQPFHMLIFYILIVLPVGITSGTGTSIISQLPSNAVLDMLIGTNYSNLGMQLYTIIAMSMIRPAEKFLMKLFEFGNQQIAKEASTETGVKVVSKVVKTAVQVASLATGVGAAAGLGGAALGNANKIASQMASGGKGPGGLPGGGDEDGNSGDDNNNESGFGLGEDETSSEGTGPDMSYPLEQDAYNWAPNPAGAALPTQNSQTDQGNNNQDDKDQDKLSDAIDDLSEAAEDLSGAAEDLSEAGENLQEGISFADDTEELPDGYDGSNRLESIKNYLLSPEGKEKMYNVAESVSSLRGELYLSGDSPGEEFKNGILGQLYQRAKIPDAKKQKLEEYVNNEENINYMIQQHGLLNLSGVEAAKKIEDPGERARAIDQETKKANDSAKSKAKDMLKGAAPFVERGITDIRTVDQLMSRAKGSSGSEQISKVIKNYAKAENYVSNSNSVQAMQQVIARESGQRADSPQVITQARETVHEAGKYVEAGVKKDPEVLNRLVRLESMLKAGGVKASGRSVEKVVKMDKVIEKAVKDNLGSIKMPNFNSSAEVAKIQKAMNAELSKRLEIQSSNSISTSETTRTRKKTQTPKALNGGNSKNSNN